jgi:hypothetical protein
MAFCTDFDLSVFCRDIKALASSQRDPQARLDLISARVDQFHARHISFDPIVEDEAFETLHKLETEHPELPAAPAIGAQDNTDRAALDAAFNHFYSN